MSGPDLEACRNPLEADGRAMLLEASGRARATLQSLEALLKNLAPLKMPVNIVLISEGMFVARDRSEHDALGRLAAEARATIHVMRPSQQFFDVEDRAPGGGMTRFFDDGLMSEGLEQVAGQTRGSMSVINGDGQIAFDRLGRELSGYYLLGFEPTEADRTGRERRIKVSVKTRGLTVRARPTFVIPAANAAAAEKTMTPMQQLGEVLQIAAAGARPADARRQLFGDRRQRQIRVVITAEIGDPATTPAEWPIGVIVLDKNDKIVINRGGVSTLAPASKGLESPRLLLTSVALDPGEYTLRIASVDDTGRGGSVHHSINARLNRLPNGITVSDLILVAQPPAAGELPRPRPTTVIDNETVSAMLEMTGADQALLGKTKVSADYGKSWTKIVSGIKPDHFTRVIRADVKRKGLLYAGTEYGMYVSFDDGGKWEPFQLNLPITPITDLAIKNDDLIVATQGRSFWVLDDLTPLHQWQAEHESKSLHAYKPRDAMRLPGGGFGGGDEGGGPRLVGANPPSGVVIQYHVKDQPDPKQAASLEILDQDGKLLRKFTSTAERPVEKIEPKKGMNRFVWNLRHADAEGFPGMIIWGSLTGPRAVPGGYQAKLKSATTSKLSPST